MDSDHRAPFAEWYVDQVLPRVRSGGTVIVDDVFHPQGPEESGGEGPVVLDWLRARSIDYFQASHHHAPDMRAAILRKKELLGLSDVIVRAEPIDPAIYFTMP